MNPVALIIRIAHLRTLGTYQRLPLKRQPKMHINADRLVRSSFFLMATMATMALLGFGFSLVVTRLYRPEQVGAGTSLISATSLIAYLSLFGLNVTVVRWHGGATICTQVRSGSLVFSLTLPVRSSRRMSSLATQPSHTPASATCNQRELEKC